MSKNKCGLVLLLVITLSALALHTCNKMGKNRQTSIKSQQERYKALEGEWTVKNIGWITKDHRDETKAVVTISRQGFEPIVFKFGEHSEPAKFLHTSALLSGQKVYLSLKQDCGECNTVTTFFDLDVANPK